MGARLLVSVRDAREALEALAGGAQIIDAKDPGRGALGAVEPRALAAIAAALPDETPLSVALGDALEPSAARRATEAAADAGAAFVKLGVAGVRDRRRIERSLGAAVHGAEGRARVIAVAYADAERAGAASPASVIEAAAASGAGGVLLDSAVKDGGGLFDLLGEGGVASFIDVAREHALLVALAGSLDAAGAERAVMLGADIVGVRGAACEGGRTGLVSAARVRSLAELVDPVAR